MATQTSFFENIFGFQFKRKAKEEQIPSIIAPPNPDGSLVVGAEGNHYGLTIDIEGQVKTENELIRRYRETAKFQEVDSAIEDIVNEAIVTDQEDYPVKLELDLLNVPNAIKKKLQDEFQNILNLLDFNEKGHDLFRQWYVDGRLYAHILFEKENTKDGIAEIRFIDPRKVKKIKQVKRQRNDQGIEVVVSTEEYYVYNDKGISENNVTGVKMSLDSIVLCGSGTVDGNSGMMIGCLDKAIKPANQLKMIEDAIVIYRITRAPERRIFYIDVGNLPKHKAEQYVTDMMNKFKNKLVYDAHTGEVADTKRHMSMMEDFWMPRREGGKGTEITTLPGGQGLNQLDDLEYFKKKLMQSLNVPMSRTKEETGFTLGQSQTISRDELKFNKFIGKLRLKFTSLFVDLLKVQLVAKGIIGLNDWKDIKQKIRFDFIQDNHFAELKNIEVLQSKLAVLQQVDPYCGKYFSKAWIQREVLHMDEEEIEEIADEIQEEGVAANPVVPGQQMIDSDGNVIDQLQMQQDAQDAAMANSANADQTSPQEDQQMDNDQEAHDQEIRHKEEMHKANLKKVNSKK